MGFSVFRRLNSIGPLAQIIGCDRPFWYFHNSACFYVTVCSLGSALMDRSMEPTCAWEEDGEDDLRKHGRARGARARP